MQEDIEKIKQLMFGMQKRTYLRIGATAVLITASAFVFYRAGSRINTPKEIVPLEKDLNGDGVPDAYILQQGGHKVPMYGWRPTANSAVEYRNAHDIKRLNDDIQDYQSIEDRLNE